MSAGAQVVVFSLTWAAFGLASGWWAARWSAAALDHDTWLTRTRRWERDGRIYERLHVRRWKDHLPEAGAWFGDGGSKRRLPGRTDSDLRRFAGETRRAEWVHWMNIGFAPTFALWCSAGVTAAMVLFAIVVHLPFVVVQRYNRARLLRLLSRQRRSGSAPVIRQ